MAKTSISDIQNLFYQFKQSGESNENFRYWNLYLNFFYPAMRDFEFAVRTGDFDFFLSGVDRSILILFATGRTHYKRFATLFQQDLLTYKESSQYFTDILKRVTLLPR